VRSLRIGTAGWAIPRAVADAFPAKGSSLERYAARFDAVEINSTFYRSHRASTYARWVATTPTGFRFALKLPRTITHEARLADVGPRLAAFVAEALQLAPRIGPLLVQLPPSFAFDAPLVETFLALLHDHWAGDVAWEPRHPSWFDPRVDALLAAWRVSRAAADPACHDAAGRPGGWKDLAYWRLHGAPRMYWSDYDEAALRSLAAEIAASEAPEIWVVFDNTASGAAAADALRLQALMAGT
jgi:uncharacterized protein YecE (DUF72 family)